MERTMFQAGVISSKLILRLLIVLSIRYSLVSGACVEMEERKAGAKEPILDIRVLPDDNEFATGENFTVTCIAMKSDNQEDYEDYLVPYEMIYFVNHTKMTSLCSKPNVKEDRKTCFREMTGLGVSTTRFTCRTSNDFGCTSGQVYIRVIDPSPASLIATPPLYLNVTEGEPVNITCQSNDLPRPTVTWYKDDKPANQSVLWYRGSSSLVISAASIKDQGEYFCTAENTYGHAQSNKTNLQVFAEPAFTEEPLSQSVTLGENVTLTCTARGNPPPDITWMLNGTRLDKESQWIRSILIITNASLSAHGWYSCLARSRLGQVTSQPAFLAVSLPVTDPPSAVFKSQAVRRESGLETWVIVSSVLAATALCMILVFGLYLCRTRRERLSRSYKVNEIEKTNDPVLKVLFSAEREFKFEEANNNNEDDATYIRMMGMEREWEIPRDRLTLTDEALGSGCFGKVVKGMYLRTNGAEMTVAVKQLKDNAREDDRRDMMTEMDILKHVGRHPNVVSLVGACTLDEPLFVVIEFVEGGDLRDLLLKSRMSRNKWASSSYENLRSRLNERQLLFLALGVARGMAHLEEKQCIHRDLAARNVLVGLGLVAKVADFGLARHVTTDGLYIVSAQTKLPWKWMAPESLRGLYTTKSDVWSFGVVLWEIATLGETPYPNEVSIMKLLQHLIDGHRMSKPPYCDEEIYKLMLECWQLDPAARPSFKEIERTLKKLLEEAHRTYVNVSPVEDEIAV
ncbi:fibroblast growth factor receptor isoform X3 [Nematostella vectensis]|uniref:fibroblast growth factor receptor isoform X3 n=1 Tax=Nematostella vectensis TaxID=45351 RepID=UPI0020773EC4|nr:fibroblast growth factor receptor isoform X3 [Nematostella vectensis]